ncbi:motility protein A [Sphingomonas sp. LT1P40]|uniref:motility protein A n=1 Tax=Alteristakelama amylovorans TaxID=3096166 RepID=UPI002FCC53E5
MNIAVFSEPAAAAATFVPGIFLDPPAIGIVLGGTVASVVLRNQLGDVGRSLRALGVMWRRPFSADALLNQTAALERIARRHGVLALDRSVIDDPDMAAAVTAAVDGASPDQAAAIVTDRANARAERHRAAIEVWTGAAEAAPAMGLIGTILGLVQMFASMEDPDKIGAAMAVALLATLYGALVANLLAMPVAARLKRLARAEATERLRLAAPLAALATLERARKRDVAA